MVIDAGQVPNKVCRVGIVGAGYMAQQWAQAIAENQNLELVAVCSRTDNSARKLASQFKECRSFSNLHLMHDECSPEFIIVAVSVNQTAEVLTTAGLYAWKILVEKPLGINLQQAETLTKALGARRNDIFVAFNRRFYKSSARVADEVRKSSTPVFIDVHDQQDTVRAQELGTPGEVLESWMFANSIHTIDLFRFIGRGEVVSISTRIESVGEAQRVVMADFRFDSGDFGRYVCHWNLPGYWALEVLTIDQRWEMKPLENLASQATSSRLTRRVPITPDPPELKHGLKNLAANLYAAYLNSAHSLPTMSDSLQSMRLVAKIFNVGTP